jgi:hypothetical protein
MKIGENLKKLIHRKQKTNPPDDIRVQRQIAYMERLSNTETRLSSMQKRMNERRNRK